MDYEKHFRLLPVLKKRKNPTIALIVGFLAGGIGLAIYFRKVIDFFIPLFAVIVIEILHTQFQGQGFIYVLAGAVVAAAYGYLRAMYSNQVIDEREAAASAAVSGGAATASSTGAVPGPANAPPASSGVPPPASAGGFRPAPATGFGPAADAWWENTAAGPAATAAEPPVPPAQQPWWEK
jgi:hypothetical protein